MQNFEVLNVEALCKSFGGLAAIKDLHLSLPKGGLTAIIGPNGAGKTTFFNLLTGFHKPDSGSVIWKGENILGLKPNAICRKGIARSFQVAAIYLRMSVMENIKVALFSAHQRDMDIFSAGRKCYQEPAEKILESVGLSGKADTLSNNLSHGDRKRLELGIVLGNEPELLLLDEPTAGMSMAETVETMKLIKKLNREHGISVLFTEHNMSFVFGVAEEIYVLNHGQVVTHGPPTQIRGNELIKKIYLGEK